MATEEQGRRKAVKAVEHFFKRYDQIIGNLEGVKYFDQALMNDVKLIDAGPEGGVVFDLVISQEYANMNGVMHGGAAGVIFDMCTTIALCPLAKNGFWDFLGGVTRTLNISYLKAVPIGETVRVSSNVIQAGRQMAMLQGKMTSQDGQRVYCTCEHHKVHMPVNPEHLKLWTEENWEKSTL